MPISSDFSIDYTYKRIYHSSGTTIYTVNELYSWLMDVFDESGTIDDTIPMTAQTSTAYTLVNGWFINYADDTLATNDSPYPSFHYLYGGSIQTSGWDGTTNANGIRILYFQSGGYTEAISSDIGKVVTDGTDTGTLLDFDNTARKWWVRQDATDDDFPSGGSITITSGTGAGTLSQNSPTGNNIWANPFTIGTLVSDTLLYIYQDNSPVTSWWADGHIDILLLTKESGALIDEGMATVYARHYGSLYDHFVTDLSAGARTPIPLAAFDDTNNDTGYLSMAFTTASDDFTLGEVIDGGTSGAQGIVTSNTGTAPNITIEYYLIGDVTIDFHSSGAETVTGATSGTTATSVSPTNTGPNTGTPATITVTFGGTTQDVDNNGTAEPYSVTVDCQQVALTTVYERLKYLTRRGATGDIDNGTQSVIGEQYEAVGDYYLPYDTLSGGTFTEGGTLTSASQPTFSGTITSDYDRGGSDGFLVVRHVSGTVPTDGESLTDGTASAVVDEDGGSDPVTAITPTKQAPFGTFAGGNFFGARGVLLTDVPAADANDYELIDSEGNSRTPPQSVPITISNTEAGDRVSVFKTTGVGSETLDRSMFAIQQAHTAPVGYIRVDPGTVTADTPTTGTIRVVRRNASGAILGEERYAYTGWTTGGSYDEFSLSGSTTIDYDTDDTAYVPYVDEEAGGASVSKSISYVADRNVLTRVRIVGMLPFKSTGTITNTGLPVTVIRTDDVIYQ